MIRFEKPIRAALWGMDYRPGFLKGRKLREYLL